MTTFRGDTALINRMIRESVTWFHEARQHPDNADRDMYELARECANGAFKHHAMAIPVSRREIVARKFMDKCRETFAIEVVKAAATPEPELVN